MITVGIPFFNNEATILEAIRSVFAQTFQDWELILLDDGSTDRSLEIAKSVKDKRIRVISDGMNKQLPIRLNQITKEAKGEIIARMDADDIMHPLRLEKQVGLILTNPAATCVSSPTITICRNNNIIAKRGFKPEELLTPNDIFYNRVMIHPTLLSYTDWFKRNPYEEKTFRSQDAELWCRCYINNDLNIKQTVEPLFFYRENGNLKVGKILESYKNKRKIMRTYGPLLVGDIQTNKAIMLSYLKSIIIIFLFISRNEKYLISRRNLPLKNSEKYYAQKWLNYVFSTHVPGID